MATDARLCPLAHFDFNGRAGLQIFFVYAKPSGSYLHDGVRPVLVEILMQATFAGIVIDAQLAGRFG